MEPPPPGKREAFGHPGPEIARRQAEGLEDRLYCPFVRVSHLSRGPNLDLGPEGGLGVLVLREGNYAHVDQGGLEDLPEHVALFVRGFRRLHGPKCETRGIEIPTPERLEHQVAHQAGIRRRDRVGQAPLVFLELKRARFRAPEQKIPIMVEQRPGVGLFQRFRESARADHLTVPGPELRGCVEDCAVPHDLRRRLVAVLPELELRRDIANPSPDFGIDYSREHWEPLSRRVRSRNRSPCVAAGASP